MVDRAPALVKIFAPQTAELDQILLKCISITKYKLHFLKVIQILFPITLAMTGKIQNTKYIS